jgi:hypothetical protein
MNKNAKKKLENFENNTYGLIQLEHFDKDVVELECNAIASRLRYTS